MDETTVLKWLAGKTDAQTLFLVTMGVLVMVEAAKRAARRIWPPGAEEFKDWWLLGAGLGAGLGLVLIDRTVAGAGVGLVAGALATGGFEYLKGAGRFLGPPSAALILCALGASLALSTAGCAGHGYLVKAQEAQLEIYDQVRVGISEYHAAALAELAAAEARTREALALGLAEDLVSASAGRLMPTDAKARIQAALDAGLSQAEADAAGRFGTEDAKALVGAILAEYDGQLSSIGAERAVLAERLSRLDQVIALGKETATQAAEIEVRRFATLEALRGRLLDVIQSRASP